MVDHIDPDGSRPARRAERGPAALPSAAHQRRRLGRGVPAHRRSRRQTPGSARAAGQTRGSNRELHDNPAVAARHPHTTGSGCTTPWKTSATGCSRTDPTPHPDAGGTPATVIITFDLEDLLANTGYAVASDGTLIRTDQALRLADQADIYFAAVTAKGVCR